MKNLALFICIIFSCCSGLDQNGLKGILNNNSFEWHVSTPDTTTVHRMHFFQDSLYVLVVKDRQDTSHSVFGYWHVKRNLLHTSLWLSNRIYSTDSEFILKSYHDGTLKLAYKTDHASDNPKRRQKFAEYKNRFKAIQTSEPARPDPTAYLIGSWYDPADSIFATVSEWERTGKISTNSSFKFTKDSFDIHTEHFREKGTYRMVNCTPYIMILEIKRIFENNVYNNTTIEIDYIDSTEIRLRLDKNYRLKRKGG